MMRFGCGPRLTAIALHDSAAASRAMAAGGLWNTLVLAANVGTLWHLGWQWDVCERQESP